MPDKKSRLDNFLSSKNFLRIAAVVIALIMWLYLPDDKGAEMERTIVCPVQYINVPFQSALEAQTQKVEVQLSGERQILSGLNSDKVKCQVDLEGLDPGKYSVAVRATVPRNVKLVDVVPSHAQFEIARLSERDFNVSLEVSEGLPSGLYVDSVNINPSSVRIRGREELVSSIERVRVSPTLEQLRTGGDLVLPVQIDPQSLVEDLAVTPPRVTLNAVLAKGMPKKDIPVNVRLTGEPHQDFQIDSVSVEPVTVKIEGPSAELKKISEINTETFDITGVSSNQSLILPLVPLPLDSINYLSESSVSVKIMVRPLTVTRVLPKVPVEIEGRSIYPSWKVLPEEVEIILEAVPSDFAEMDKQEKSVRAYVNVTNIVSKKLTVPVIVEVNPRGVKVTEVRPGKVKVTAQIE